MRGCEDEKMFHRPPLLEEPCAQTLSGKMKKSRKMQKHGNTKKQISKIQKTLKQNKRVKKGNKKERQKGEKMGKTWTCPIAFLLLFFCFFDLLFFFALFCFYFAVFLLFSMQKQKKTQNKSKTKAKNKQIEKAKQMQMDKSIFSHFSPFLTFLFFPFILLPVFFGFGVLLFDFPCVFLFFAFFSSLKNIRISYRGGHNPSCD